jgi:DNA-binding NarL/FixJ family response regulator
MDNRKNNHPIVSLATRELEVYHLLAKGMKTSEIAKALSLKANTISTIKKVIFKNFYFLLCQHKRGLIKISRNRDHL